MKVKKFSKWSTRILLISLMALVSIGSLSCIGPHPYETNPNLKLLVGDTTTAYDAVHCSNPVISQDGNVIYYLCVDADSLGGVFYDFAIGAVYTLNVDGNNNREIIEGKFNALSISYDGGKLGIHPYGGSYSELAPESLILIYDLNDSKIDSYPVIKKEIKDIEFAEDGQWVYYSVDASTASFNRTEFFRLHLSDSSNELLQTVDWYLGFDLFKDNSLYFDSIMVYPQINLLQENYAIGNSGYFGNQFLMRDTETDSLLNLPDSLIPYVDGSIGFPYWFSDGNTIVFSAQPYEAGSSAPAEIWILENVFE